jgi:Gly-Xaa carboxypeptidase
MIVHSSLTLLDLRGAIAAGGLEAVDACPQEPYWSPRKGQDLPDAPSKKVLAELLSGAVQVNTSTYDDYPLPVSEHRELWSAVFTPFRDYLYKAFPEVHFSKSISLELVNEHGLLYTWQGSKKNLKPLVLTAHQDVVPVEDRTLDLWEHGAFSGYIDDQAGLIFGRGAMDDKASLITILASITSLLRSGFEPERTVVLAFGFDEETSGTQGAQTLATRLEQIYGSHHDGKGVAMIVDEGNSVQNDVYGLQVAEPAVAEKGYLDVRMTVHTPGGHSSMPPKHTSIGLLSKLVSAIEDQPWPVSLSIKEETGKPDSAALASLLCMRDAPGLRKTSLGKAVDKFAAARAKAAGATGQKTCRYSFKKKRALKRLSKARQELEEEIANSIYANDFKTTQAVDLVSGGVKINALPEQASVVINHRINADDSVAAVRKRLQSIVSHVAGQYDLGVRAWQSDKNASVSDRHASYYVELSDAFESALEPAPRTPIAGKSAEPFRLLSSVIRHTYRKDAPSMRVVPTLMGGNTDTKSYWRLSRHIFRFAPATLQPLPSKYGYGGIHTVNEVVQIASLLDGHTFYTSLIVAAQEERFSSS